MNPAIEKMKVEINILKLKVKYRDSFILNLMDNWNFLRATLSWVDSSKEAEGDAFHECDEGPFLEAKEFSEAFAMNTFIEWFDAINANNGITNLDEHEKFKDYYWSQTEKRQNSLRQSLNN